MRTPGRPRGSRDRLGRATRAVPLSEPFVRFMGLVGERIRSVREDLDVSVLELAAALRVSPKTVHGWEACRRRPSVANLHRISVALGVRVTDLLPEDA